MAFRIIQYGYISSEVAKSVNYFYYLKPKYSDSLGTVNV